MAENINKVNAKIAELNKESAQRSGQPLGVASRIPQIWLPVTGYFVVTGFDFAQGKNVFNGNFGYPLKLFFNSITGEVKMFRAAIFED